MMEGMKMIQGPRSKIRLAFQGCDSSGPHVQTRHAGSRILSFLVLTCLISFWTGHDTIAQQFSESEIPTPYSSRALNLRFSHLSLEEGLSQSIVFDVIQDHNGYMWFSTQDGLNRYDGFEVRAFANDGAVNPAKKPFLRATAITEANGRFRLILTN